MKQHDIEKLLTKSWNNRNECHVYDKVWTVLCPVVWHLNIERCERLTHIEIDNIYIARVAGNISKQIGTDCSEM